MSIIQEALKKAQNYKSADEVPTTGKTEKSENGQTPPIGDKIASGKTAEAASNPRSISFALFFFVMIVILITFSVKSFLTGVHKSTGHSSINSQSGQQAAEKEMQKDETPPANIVSSAAADKSADSLNSSLLGHSITLLDDRPKSGSRYLLNGIMYLEGGSKAIINNTIVREGDTIDGAAVRKIGKNDVILEVDGSEVTLRVI